MNLKLGFTHIVLVILISVMAVSLVGVAWWYEENKETSEVSEINSQTPISANVNASFKSDPPENTLTKTIVALDDSWQEYSNEDLHISFSYPEKWGPPEEFAHDGSDYGEGKMKRISFNGTGATSFNSIFQVLYSTVDYAPGREIWLGEYLSKFDDVTGLKNICTVNIIDIPFISEVSICSIEQKGGRWQASFVGRIDALGGENVTQFVKVFAFQTNNTEFPVAALVLFLPEVNKDQWVSVEHYPDGGYWQGIPTDDTDRIQNVYDVIKNKKADDITNNHLNIFEQILSSFQFLEEPEIQADQSLDVPEETNTDQSELLNTEEVVETNPVICDGQIPLEPITEEKPISYIGGFNIPANWEGYTDETYGFTFRYPPDWNPLEPLDGETGIQIAPPDISEREDSVINNFHIESVECGYSKDDLSEIKTIVLKGNYAQTAMYVNEQDATELHTYIPNGDSYFVIKWASEQDETYSEYGRMRSTFYFDVNTIDQWPVYSNNFGKFSMTFPDEWKGYSFKDTSGAYYEITFEKTIIETQETVYLRIIETNSLFDGYNWIDGYTTFGYKASDKPTSNEAIAVWEQIPEILDSFTAGST